jgi:hypothetical protein
MGLWPPLCRRMLSEHDATLKRESKKIAGS